METAVDDYIYSDILLTEATGHSISRLLRTQGNLGGPLPVFSSEGSEVSYRATPLGWLPFIDRLFGLSLSGTKTHTRYVAGPIARTTLMSSHFKFA